jgi:hypothetical protein
MLEFDKTQYADNFFYVNMFNFTTIYVICRWIYWPLAHFFYFLINGNFVITYLECQHFPTTF